ncbi:MAM domain-containing protein [Caenorhabditis elegans]|uniref:MAM domain-containing protein n=1 Tax=Caenorhabditis elegans TaxID=6239 RepID=Q95Q40_CAEEL|nr:MAM domain-containing protein [Caenorhabditis elegans]CCD70626.2 MAM domain-containing protein [Caenorhabditis elegans]|eukprot:NP_001355389.1 MAM (Meprin, A5-protein, PTPmu) domain protein [Caenorhabditis elegans]
MSQLASAHSQNTIVSKILQVALGLFVTTSDLPPLSPNHEQLSYDCSFHSDCRWMSLGNNVDRWRVAKGEPDSLLWLAATGTMQIPREPYALIESRGNPVDALVTDAIRCQMGYAELSFTYWVIGNADIEICLTDLEGGKFNCTGVLNSSIMPGKVSLKIPELQKPFRIMIQPSSDPGVVVLDDIRYDASICHPDTSPETNSVRGRPDFMTTSPPKRIRPWTVKQTKKPKPTEVVPVKEIEEETTTTTTTTTTTQLPTTTTTEEITTTMPSGPTTEVPFDLLIVGNRTRPLNDRRSGEIVDDSTQLLCDFNNEFACRWGPEAGRWAIIDSGAIPSLEDSIADPLLLPTFPAGLVLQGTAMLSSDPIQCQTGNAKVLFRYWSNGDILLQVCALGHGDNNDIIHCVEQSRSARHERNTLAVFELNKDITGTFTLNIVPQWESGLKNRFLVIDEIAYIGQCDKSKLEPTSQAPLILGRTTQPKEVTIAGTKRRIQTTPTPTTTTTQVPEIEEEEVVEEEETTTTRRWPTTTTSGYTKKRRIFTTFAPVFPEEVYTQTSKPRKSTWTTTPEPKQDDYCDILNCSFDDTACNYLNHGLTKKPWTLRNRGYGYPLTGTTDIRATQTNGQFVSAILDAEDIAILESPKFNATRSLNVLLFQYFRPSQMTTIRLCLGSRYTNPMRTVSSFVQCPSILRSVTSKNAYRWNTVHIQLPPGTTHFYLVAHSSEKSESRAAIAIDNMRVAICDTRGFAPDYIDETTDFQSVLQL